MIEQVGGLMGGLTGGGVGGGRRSAGANNSGSSSANMAPNDTIYLCNFRLVLFEEKTKNFFLILVFFILLLNLMK